MEMHVEPQGDHIVMMTFFMFFLLLRLLKFLSKGGSFEKQPV
jgi:hypothetical protein